MAAIFWLSVCGASFSLLRHNLDLIEDAPLPDVLKGIAFILLGVLFVMTPFMAVGALFGRTDIGARVGVIVVVLCLGVLVMPAVG